jgi:hypothetical protein
MRATFRLHNLNPLALRVSFMAPLSSYRPFPDILECAECQDSRSATVFIILLVFVMTIRPSR